MSYLNELTTSLNAGYPDVPNTVRIWERNLFGHMEFMRLADAVPACRNDQAMMGKLRAALDEARTSCQQAAKGSGGNCQAGVSDRPETFKQRTQTEFNRIVASAQGDTGGPAPAVGASVASNGGGAGSSCARTPDAELAAFNAEVADVQRAHPLNAALGARATYQWTHAFSIEALNRIEPHRVCLGPNYAPNHDALVRSRDTARKGCDMLANNIGSGCPQTFP